MFWTIRNQRSGQRKLLKISAAELCWLVRNGVHSQVFSLQFLVILWHSMVFTDWYYLFFVLQFSAIATISALCVASICSATLLSYFRFTYSLRVSAFGLMHFIHCCICLVFLQTFSVCSNFQFLVPKFCLNIETANDPIANYYYYYCCYHLYTEHLNYLPQTNRVSKVHKVVFSCI